MTPKSFAAPRLIMVASGFGWGAERIKSQVSRHGHYVCGRDPPRLVSIIAAVQFGTCGMAKYRIGNLQHPTDQREQDQ